MPCSGRTSLVAEPLTFGVAFSAGLVSFLSPCVLPLFPSYVSFVTGMSVDRLSAELQIAERVRAAGLALEGGPVVRGGALGPMQSVYFRDPDGNLVEVARYPDEAAAD